MIRIICLALVCSSLMACSGGCDADQATNKMLAFGKVQGRLVAKGGEAGMQVSLALAQESGAIGELIAKQDYAAACKRADEMAKKYDINLDAEQKDMITVEQLRADGGKGSGTCGLADAAKKNMEIHGLLQAEVTAGKRSSDVFREFNDDTLPLAEMMSTHPSKACELLEGLRKKYNLP